MSNMFKVASIKNLEWGPSSIVRASVDIEILPHGIILKDCLLKEGQYGWFLSSPSKKLDKAFITKDGKEKLYLDQVFFPKAIRDELNRICVEAYDPNGNYPGVNHQQHNNQADTEHPLTDTVEEIFSATDDMPL